MRVRDGIRIGEACRLAALAVAVLALAACGDDGPAGPGGTVAAAAARTAAAAGAPAASGPFTGTTVDAPPSPPDPPDRPLAKLLDAGCQQAIAKADRKGIAAARKIDALERSARALGAQYDRTVARVRELSGRIDAIRAELDATSDYAAANRLVDEGNALIREHNQLIQGLDILAERARTESRTADRSIGRALDANAAFERRARRCADGVGDGDWAIGASTLEQRLATALHAVVEDGQVRLNCVSPSAWRDLAPASGADGKFVLSGFVERGTKDISLSPATCLALDDVVRHRVPRAATPDGTGCAVRAHRRHVLALCGPRAAMALEAVETLAHEAEHAQGVEDEASATCYAMQHVLRYARALGLPAATARVVGAYAEAAASRPAAYRSKACRKGGKLDLRLKTTVWPS